MKTISISEAKATLSEQIRRVRRGEEVLILDRGRPVARLVPARDQANDQALRELEGEGLIRRGTGLDKRFLSLERPKDPDGAVRVALIAERESGL